MLLVKETFVNETKGWIFNESGFYPPYTEEVKELFRAMQKEYGRCISRVKRSIWNSFTRKMRTGLKKSKVIE